MRVIAGTAKRLPLKTIDGQDTRPTTDRIKETLFNMINLSLLDSNFLDLFSGSGGIGIEALSRGAKKAVFIENNSRAVQCIKENLKFTHLEQNSLVISSHVMAGLKKLEGSIVFDIIFMDPPYDLLIEKEVLHYLRTSALADSDTLIIVEASAATDFEYLEEYGYEVLKEKNYKTNKHMFISLKP